MPIEIEQPDQIRFLGSLKFNQDHFANVEVIGSDLEPLHVTMTQGQFVKMMNPDQFGKTTLVFKPVLKDGAQLKELEYALQRYMAEQLKVNGEVRPINHEVLYVKWPRIKQGIYFVNF